MKIKYSAMAALALWLCVVAWVSAMIVAKPTVFSGYSAEDDSAFVAQLQQNINHNLQLHAALVDLAETRGWNRSGPVVTPDSTVLPGPAGSLIEADVVVSHAVSMIISTDHSRRALVDGQLVRRGSRLRDGSKVSEIGKDWVRLMDATGRVLTLHVPGPFANVASGFESGR